MKHFLNTLILLAITGAGANALADFAPLTDEAIKEMACNSVAVVAGTLTAQEVDDFAVFHPDEFTDEPAGGLYPLHEFSEGTIEWYNRGELTISQTLKDPIRDKVRKVEDILLDGRSNGSFAHMRFSLKVGEKGIWFLSQRDSIKGYRTLVGSPEIPLPLSKISKIRRMLKTCP